MPTGPRKSASFEVPAEPRASGFRFSVTVGNLAVTGGASSVSRFHSSDSVSLNKRVQARRRAASASR